MSFTKEDERCLITLAKSLVDPHEARVLVTPNENRPGFWFGGGNMMQASNGPYLLVGRYRNEGDSRSGLVAGERGVELAIFKVVDAGQTANKIASFSKQRLGVGDQRVLSIEGAAIREWNDGIELWVSTEKTNRPYPDGFGDYLKPGTGCWTIDRLWARDIESLQDAEVQTVVEGNTPGHWHVKDPVLYEHSQTSDVELIFCTHPYNWASSNTAAVGVSDGRLVGPIQYQAVSRGTIWDVAMTRVTCAVKVPPVGRFAGRDLTLLFYDGGECVREHAQHAAGVRRPRGYSCEEIGGAMVLQNDNWNTARRLSANEPLFISPYGTGCNRYVDVLSQPDGLIATWQMAQEDGSQPLVVNQLSLKQIHSLAS